MEVAQNPKIVRIRHRDGEKEDVVGQLELSLRAPRYDGDREATIIRAKEPLDFGFMRNVCRNAVFENLSLRHASFDGSRLEAAEFRRCDLTSATFRDGTGVPFPLFDACVLDNADFTGADLTAAVFAGQPKEPTANIVFARATMTNASLGLDFRVAAFDFAKMKRATIDGQELDRCRFFGTDLEKASFDGSTLRECIFENTSLEGTSFRGTTLHACVFRNCSFIGAFFEKAVIEGCAFEDCVAGADLSFELAHLAARPTIRP